MKVALQSRRNRKLVAELLGKRGFQIVDDSPVVFLETGLPLDGSKITIVYSPDSIDSLFEFIDSLIFRSNNKKELDIVTGKHEDAYQVIQADDVSYFIADGNNTYFKVKNAKYEINKKLYELERDFSHKGFVRVNKSHVVNILKLKEIVPWFGGRLLLLFNSCDDEIEVSRRYVASFKEFLGL